MAARWAAAEWPGCDWRVLEGSEDEVRKVEDMGDGWDTEGMDGKAKWTRKQDRQRL